MSLKTPKRLKGASPSHVRSRSQEKEVARRLVRGSGSGLVKGDVREKGVLRIECKTTKNASFPVTADIVRKLEEAVAGADEIPLLEVELLSGKMKVYVMPAWAFDYIQDAARAARKSRT